MCAVLLIFLQASFYSLAFGENVFEGADSVVLPCQYSGLLLEENPTVTWRRYDLKPQTVHLRREEDDLHGQNQRFSGRTSMKPDALDSGDFSLSLKNPHSSDSGTYTCSMNDDREEIRLADVQLEVRVQQVEVKVEEGVEFAILPCKTTAYLEEDATVEWTRSEPEFMVAYVYQNYSNKVKEQHKFYCERTEMSKEKVKVGDLSLTLKYPTERDTGVYICTIYRKGDIVRQKVILHLLKEIFSSWAKAFLILLIILLVFGGLLFHFRQYLQSVYKLEINSGLESVTLPCKSIVCLPKDVTITWRNNKKHVVHMHQGNSIKIEEQHRRYKDRTQMKESFKLGDFSLILKNPTDKDTDIYTCTISNISEDILIKKQVLLDVRAGADSFIIAIDIGSAYTGYAFYVNPQNEGGETQIKRWGKELGLDSPKAPTCILLDEREKFLKFGYEAKTVYNNMKEEEAEKHYFFENFKMGLNCRDLRNQKVKATDGKSVSALKVFTEVLRYLKDDALDTIKAQTTEGEIEVSDFTWVLNVPASWGYKAKQFLKDSATQAGLVTEGTKSKLKFVLDSEAALAWCLKLPADRFITENHSRESQDQSAEITSADLSSGDPPRSQEAVNIEMKPEETANLLKRRQRNMKRYVVVDCGDEMIEFTAHEVLEGGVLQKLFEFPGNKNGGENVLNKFKQFLREIFCDGVWDEYEENYQREVQRMLNDFTCLKRVDEEILIRCPHSLANLAKKKKNIEMFFESKEGASWDDDGFIRITREKLRSFFAESLQGITESLREIFNRDHSIGSIVLVGGLTENQIIHQHIIDQFGHQYKVLVPLSPQEVVLKGAVELGRNLKLVSNKKKGPAWFKCFSEI